MDNFFLSRLFDWDHRYLGRWLPRAQLLLKKAGLSWQLRRPMDPTTEMTNIEQRVNLWHMAVQPVAYGVPGDYVELGSFDGKTAVIFQKAIEGTARKLHVFDHFEMGFHLTGRDIRRQLEANFRIAGAGDPVIHAGDFANTVPQELPAQIAFVHIDCGFGGDPVKHAETVKTLLSHVYPRMPTGAIGVLMDFYDPVVNKGTDFNPGAGQAAREFFADKPEKVSALWADEYVHGYFRKK